MNRHKWASPLELCFGPCHHRTTNAKHQHRTPSFDEMAHQEEQSLKRKSGQVPTNGAPNGPPKSRIRAVQDQKPRSSSKSLSRALAVNSLTPTKFHKNIALGVMVRILGLARQMRLLRHPQNNRSIVPQHLLRARYFYITRLLTVRNVLAAAHPLTGSTSA